MCNHSRRDALKKSLLGITLLSAGAAPAVMADRLSPENSPDVFNARPLSKEDEACLRRAIDIARQGIQPENGSNRPYGALIRFEDGSTMEAWNTVAQKGDSTRHAEMTLLTKLFDSGMHWKKDRHKLNKATIYTSAEPCFMCAGAIFWSGIGRVVYAVSAHQVDEIYKEYFPDTGNSQLPASAMAVLAATGIDINGPYLVDESAAFLRRAIKAQSGQDNPFKKRDQDDNG